MNRRTQKILVAAVLALLGLLSTTLLKPPELDPVAPLMRIQPDAWYPVVRVVDGDTLVVNILERDVTVRLIGLDAPESVDPRQPVQCFGKEAAAELKKIAGGTSVRLETDPTQGTYDKYNRLLAYVYIPLSSKQEGLLANKYMIAEGYGHEYTYNIPYKYQADFKAAERLARDAQKGLWASGKCDYN